MMLEQVSINKTKQKQTNINKAKQNKKQSFNQSTHSFDLIFHIDEFSFLNCLKFYH
jgi:hypothetical protein